MEIVNRLTKLRELMEKHQLHAYIVPSSDPHLSEYVAEHYKSRQWISGFTGSAGTVVITLADAGLWTDGRYYIQAGKQLENTGITLFRAADPNVPSYTQWLKDNLPEGSTVAFDGRVFSAREVKKMKEDFAKENIQLKLNFDLVGELWEGRPLIPAHQIFIHDLKYAGLSRREKLQQLRERMGEKGANSHLLSALDDIAWLLNIRGSDVPHNPVTITHALITDEICYLCIDEAKISNEVRTDLEGDGIQIKGYEEIETLLQKLQPEDKILLDPSLVNSRLYYSINPQTVKIEEKNPTILLKAVKNDIELENMKKVNILDGVAMVKFIKWLKSTVGKEKITELTAEATLEEFRRESEECVDISFDTISAYKDHAAMMHYKASTESAYTLQPEGLYLVDSGGQYYGGTTDITRTISLGPLTDEEKRDFTLVLKGHIALSSVKFLYGATGSNLDVLARQPIWKYGMDYKCGTGHGVGIFLNVHEGPQRFSQTPNTDKLEAGMIITNEPGIYKEGNHGIRTENMLVVVKDEETESGQFLIFEPITYCPIDLDAIDHSLLNSEEENWLKEYHEMVYNKLESYLNEEERAWLTKETLLVK